MAPRASQRSPASSPARRRCGQARSRYLLIAAGVLLVVDRRSCGPPTLDQFLQFTILGIAFGSIYAIAAAGLVLTYTTTGVFNFAHGALGMIVGLRVLAAARRSRAARRPSPLVIVLGVVGPLIGLVLELMFRRFRDADVGTTIVLTIAVTVLCIGVAQYAFKAPRPTTSRSCFERPQRRRSSAPRITWDNVLQIVLAIAIAVGLRVLLFREPHRHRHARRRRQRHPRLAQRRQPDRTIARISWILGTELAVVAGILFASGTNLEAITLTFFVVSAYGAAVFGKLRSLPLTFAGAIVLGVAPELGAVPVPQRAARLRPRRVRPLDVDLWRRINVSLPGIFLFFALLALPQAKLTVGRIVGRQRAGGADAAQSRSSAAAPSSPSWPSSCRSSPTPGSPTSTRALIFGVILLSLVLLTGFSGQVSLAQYVFVALGAWAMGNDLRRRLDPRHARRRPLRRADRRRRRPARRCDSRASTSRSSRSASPPSSAILLIQDPHLLRPRARHRRSASSSSASPSPATRRSSCCAPACSPSSASAVLALKPRAVRAPARGHARQPGGVRHPRARHPHARSWPCSASRRSSPGWPGRCSAACRRSVSDIAFEPINNIVLFLFAVVGGVTTVVGAFFGGALFALLPFVQSE